MSEFAIYVHEEHRHTKIHKISCKQIKKTGVGDVTEKGFWVECDSLEAARRLCTVLDKVWNEPGARNGDWYCDKCKPNE